MDVSYYIGELLGLHGDVNVPGLGYFAHTRVNGYYDERESRFYPPGHSVQFDPQFFDDDDALAVHIAEKKKISVASSKYFTEKYVSSLRQQAAQGEAPLGELGWFSITGNQLVFRGNAISGTDPEFYGYPPIPLARLGSTTPPLPLEETVAPPPVVPAPEPDYQPMPYYPPVGDQSFESSDEHEEYLIELTNQRRRKNTWVFVVLAILLACLIGFLVQRYDPSAFKFNFGSKTKTPQEPKIVMVTDDTIKKPSAAATSADTTRPINDTAANAAPKAATTVKDISTIPRYEVIGGSFKDLKEATAAIIDFKRKGIDAKIVPDVPGKRVKVSVGTFITMGQAEDNKKQLIASKKIGKDAYVQPINPKDTTTGR